MENTRKGGEYELEEILTQNRIIFDTFTLKNILYSIKIIFFQSISLLISDIQNSESLIKSNWISADLNFQFCQHILRMSEFFLEFIKGQRRYVFLCCFNAPLICDFDSCLTYVYVWQICTRSCTWHEHHIDMCATLMVRTFST